MPVHYLSRLAAADQKSFKIGTAANSGGRPKVLMAQIETGAVIEERVESLYATGQGIKEWVQLKVTAEGGSGYRYLNFSAGTVVAAPGGKVYAKDLVPGDFVMGAISDITFSEKQLELIRGTCLGDGSLRQVSLGKASLRVGHGVKQNDYMKWKHRMLKPFARSITKVGRGYGFDSYASTELATLREHLYGSRNERIVTVDYASHLTAASVAAWFMDDGGLSGNYAKWGNGKSVIACFAVKDMEHREILADALERTCGVRPSLCKAGFMFSGEKNRVFQEAIAPYVHPNIQYKIVPRFRQPFVWHAPRGPRKLERSLKLTPLEVVSVQPMAKNRMGRGFSFQTQFDKPVLLDSLAVYGGE